MDRFHLPSLKTYAYILFDLDGTLITTDELIIACFEFSLGTLGLTFTKEQLAANIGLPLREQFQRFIAMTDAAEYSSSAWTTFFHRFRYVWRNHHLSPLRRQHTIKDEAIASTTSHAPLILSQRDLDRLAKRHMDYQKLIWKHYVYAFSSVSHTLRALQAKGRQLAIVTSRYRETTLLYLKEVGLLDYFKVIVTPEDTKRGKPDGEPILKALSRLELALPVKASARHQGRETPISAACLADTLYVGDTAFDSQAAHHAGVDFYHIKWQPTAHSNRAPTTNRLSTSDTTTTPINQKSQNPSALQKERSSLPYSTYTEDNFEKLLTL